MYDQFSAAEFAYDEFLWLRIRNAAKMHGDRPREFIWKVIWGAVCESEAEMIVSPSTGRFLVDPDEFDQFLEVSSRNEEAEE